MRPPRPKCEGCRDRHSLPSARRIQLVTTHAIPDATLCGVAFCGTPGAEVCATTAYDVGAVMAFPL